MGWKAGVGQQQQVSRAEEAVMGVGVGPGVEPQDGSTKTWKMMSVPSAHLACGQATVSVNATTDKPRMPRIQPRHKCSL